MATNKKTKVRRRKPYSRGELNNLIDSLIHPLYRKSDGFRLVDGLLHALAEGNPSLSLKKFFKYNSDAIIKKIFKGK